MPLSGEYPATPPQPPRSARSLTRHALDRATDAALIAGNATELLIDARANFDAWLAAIRAGRNWIFLENYIIEDDEVGREFRQALCERAASGVQVNVIYDWLGCLGNAGTRFWKPLRDAGGEIRVFNPPRLDNPFGWLGRDHRKLLAVDGDIGFVSGICLSQKWLGDPKRQVAPWRDTGVSVRGPACADIASAFADTWASLGAPLDVDIVIPAPVGDVSLRVIATTPSQASVYRTDLFVASMARETLWLTDAYFVGFAPYVQALCSAARDGVDVRLLVPGSSDLKIVAQMSRAGYRSLLEAGVRVFEWNGTMLHAKSAVADARWARVGSSNLNVASWLTNCEIDVAVEDAGFAQCMAAQYEIDLRNATEIVLTRRARVMRTAPPEPRRHRGTGSSSRAAASTIRLVNTVGAVLGNRRTLGTTESGLLPPAALALIVLALLSFVWPAILAWPLAIVALWAGIAMLLRYFGMRRKRKIAGDASGNR